MDAAALSSQAQFAATQPKPVQGKAQDIEHARKVAKDFEAMFMTQMLGHMFTGIEGENGYFGGGHAEAMFRPMLLEQYGKMIANRAGGIGLADHVTRSLLAHQEV